MSDHTLDRARTALARLDLTLRFGAGGLLGDIEAVLAGAARDPGAGKPARPLSY